MHAVSVLVVIHCQDYRVAEDGSDQEELEILMGDELDTELSELAPAAEEAEALLVEVQCLVFHFELGESFVLFGLSSLGGGR